MTETQTYKNHVRFYPLFHFVITPVLVLNLIYQAVRLYQEPSLDRGVWVVLGIAFILMHLAARLQALTAQDRGIRLEERLRYRDVLSADLAQRASGLRTGQIIALRFASDDELAGLVTQVLEGKLTTSKEIKMAVKNWRGDYLRV